MSDTPPPKPRRWRRWILEGVVVLAIFFAIRGWQSRSLASGPAPALDALDLDGAPVRLEALERPVLVHFMASWCGVCRAEGPNVRALARDHDVIAIAVQSGDADEVRAWTETDLDGARVVSDPRGSLAARWGVHAFPSSFYLDREGTIRHVEVGYSTELGMRLRMWLASL